MDLVRDLTPTVQDKINNVRKFLNIATAADVMDVTGLKVDRSFLKRFRNKFTRESKLKWPPYIQPPEGHWREWERRLLPRISSLKLERWIRGKHHQQWDYIQITRDHVIHITTPRPVLYKRDLTFVAPFFKQSTDQIPPHQINKRVSVITGGRYIVTTKANNSRRANPSNKATKTNPIRAGQIVGATDGSVKYNKGSYGWILEANSRKITGGGIVPEAHNDVDSQRAELYGIMKLIEYVVNNLRPARLKILCDNQSALGRIFSTGKIGPNKANAANMDIIIPTKKLIQKATFPIQGSWIRGHADRTNAKLTKEQCLNIEADKLANQYWSSSNTTENQHLVASIILDGKVVTKHLKESVWSWVGDQKINNYWRKKDSIPNPELMDTKGFNYAWRSMTRGEVNLTAKIVYGWAYTSERAKSIDDRTFCCPCCGGQEGKDHLWQCNGERLRSFRSKRMMSLRQKLSAKPKWFPIIEIVEMINGRGRSINSTLEGLEEFYTFDLVRGFLPVDIQSQVDSINVTRAREVDHGTGIRLFRRYMWETLRSLWIIRCEQKYGTGATGRSNAERERLLNRAENLRPRAEQCHDAPKRLAKLAKINDLSNDMISSWIDATLDRGSLKWDEKKATDRLSKRVTAWSAKGLDLPCKELFVDGEKLNYEEWKKSVDKKVKEFQKMSKRKKTRTRKPN